MRFEKYIIKSCKHKQVSGFRIYCDGQDTERLFVKQQPMALINETFRKCRMHIEAKRMLESFSRFHTSICAARNVCKHI